MYGHTPDLEYEAQRYVKIYDEIVEPQDPDRKLLGCIGAYGLIGLTIYPVAIRGVVYKIRLAKLGRASARYNFARKQNFPADNGEISHAQLRIHAGRYVDNNHN